MMEEGGMRTCPVCGKLHVVTWPHLFPYRRGEKFYCCYDCMAIDESKDMNLIHQVRRERRMRKLARMKKDGTPAKRPGPKPKTAARPDVPKPIDGGDWEKIPKPAAELKLDGTVRIETPEAKNVQVVEVPEKVAHILPDASVEAQIPGKKIEKPGKKGFFMPAYIQGFEIVGIKGQYGVYRASEEHNYFEFQPFGGDLCMGPHEWAGQIQELKKAARVLGVEL